MRLEQHPGHNPERCDSWKVPDARLDPWEQCAKPWGHKYAHFFSPQEPEMPATTTETKSHNINCAALRRDGGYPCSCGASAEVVAVPPSDSEALAGALVGWWVQKAEEEARTTVPKMIEYGGVSRDPDLAALGRNMASLIDWNEEAGVELDPGTLQELSVYFYIQGKMARWSAAIRAGRPVSDDTIFDIGVYIKMVQRIRETGGWPA